MYLKGSKTQGQRTDTFSRDEKVGWGIEDTAKDLGISVGATHKAIQIATAIEEHPELAVKQSGQSILSVAKRMGGGRIIRDICHCERSGASPDFIGTTKQSLLNTRLVMPCIDLRGSRKGMKRFLRVNGRISPTSRGFCRSLLWESQFITL